MVSTRIIYEPKGRAGEYAELGTNLYRGCTHGCTYCYAPTQLHMSRPVFHSQAAPKKDALRRLERDAKKLAGDPRPVLLCFTCEPYGPGDTTTTREAIQILHRHDLRVTVLTKGGTRALRDLDLFGDGDSYAATLTTLDDAMSLVWEPNAPLQADRVQALREFHDAGIKTWVSLEPVIDPDAALRVIEETYMFVDLFKLGTLNYHKHAKDIDWRDYASKVTTLLDRLGKDYLLKKELRKYIGGAP
jgi:DNA repair photolyase